MVSFNLRSMFSASASGMPFVSNVCPLKSSSGMPCCWKRVWCSCKTLPALMRHRMEAIHVALWRLSSGVGMLAFLPAMGKQNPMKTATVKLCNMTMYRELLSRKQANALLQCKFRICRQQLTAHVSRASGTSLQAKTKDHRAKHLAKLPAIRKRSRISIRNCQSNLLGG